jgi:hypothetical protein
MYNSFSYHYISSEWKIKRKIKELFSTDELEVLNILKNQLNHSLKEKIVRVFMDK